MFFEKCKFDNSRSKLFTQHLKTKKLYFQFLRSSIEKGHVWPGILKISVYQIFLSAYLRLYHTVV